jgi:hypothetical protein
MKINQPFSKEAQAYLDANPEIAEMIANCPDPGPPKRRVPGVALPVSAEMQDDIRNNPDGVRIVVRRKDGSMRIERPKLSAPAKGLSDPGLIAGLIFWRGELTTRWFEPRKEDKR